MMTLVLPKLRLGQHVWESRRTCVVGVVNVTPDSFYESSRHGDTHSAVAHGVTLVEQGADVLDVGGESTRPGSTPLAAAEECARVLPVITQLVRRVTVPISIDTYKAEVAQAAVEAGASIVNDVSGLLLDARMAEYVASSGVTVVLGHLRGQPSTMQARIRFEDVVAEVVTELRQRIRLAVAAGIRPEQIWVDPGLGFGKTAEQTLALLAKVSYLREELGYPLLIGPSRKSFLGALTGRDAEGRLMGTAAAVVAGILAGVDAVRVHDVAALRDAIVVADAVRQAAQPRAVHSNRLESVAP